MAVSLSSPLPSPSPSEIRGPYQRRHSYLDTANMNTPDPEFDGSTPTPPIENQDARELARRSPSLEAVRPSAEESFFTLDEGDTSIAMPQPRREILPQEEESKGLIRIVGGFDRCPESKQ